MDDDLRSKTVRAIGHLGVGGVLVKLVSLGNTLILAHLLSPADYGLMALAMMVIGFIGFLNEVGIGAAIVQKERLTEAEINGCFFIAILVGMVFFFGTILASGVIADFFGNRQLQPMISILSSAFILGAISTVPMAFLRKDMRFKAVSGLTVASVIVQSAINLVLAETGHGAWSLVWGFIAASIVNSFGAFALSGWRPKGRYGIRQATGLVVYGLHVTLTRIFWYIYTNADKAIVGKLLGTKSLGIYEMAFSLATLPSSQVTGLVVNVASPLFSKLQNDPSRLNVIVLKLTRGIAYATYPALVGMFVCSRELVAVLLGDKWMDILVPFGALCIVGIIRSVDPLLTQVLTSIGHVRKVSVYTGMCGVVMSLAVLVGALLDGLRGVSVAWVVVYPMLSVKLLSDVCRLTSMLKRDYYKSLLPALTASLAMGALVLIVRATGLYFYLPLPFVLFMEIACGIVAYLCWIVYVDFHAIGEIRQVMIDTGFSESNLDRWPFNRVVFR